MLIHSKRNQFKHFLVIRLWTLILCLIWSLFPLPPQAHAQNIIETLNLPAPGSRLNPSSTFIPALVKGLKIFPNEALRFDFIIDTGNTHLTENQFKNESSKLIKYFLASLTVAEDQQWVNLSPYEKKRIIPKAFGLTEMGRDLLAEDYVLKQFTASITYPEEDLGEDFWNQVHAQSLARYGTTDIPVNTFNKVWIVPQKAVVHENNHTAFIVDSHLKVMLESDYVALKANQTNSEMGMNQLDAKHNQDLNDLSSDIVRNLILPAIEKEVNKGQRFARLRQIYHSVILATWFKRNLKENLLNQAYVGKNKISGVNIFDSEEKEKIYQQYLKAFKIGAYDYIREDYDPATNMIIPRKYFSGGAEVAIKTDEIIEIERRTDSGLIASAKKLTTGFLKTASVKLNLIHQNKKYTAHSISSTKNSKITPSILMKAKQKLKLGAIALALSFTPFKDNLAATFDYVTTDTGDVHWIAKTEHGDTLTSIIQKAIDSRYAINIADSIQDNPYLTDLIDQGYLNTFGNVQQKVSTLQSEKDLTHIIPDINKRIYVFKLLKNTLEAANAYDAQEINKILNKIKQNNTIHLHKNKNLLENQKINMDALESSIQQIALLKTTNIISHQSINIGGRDINIYYIDQETPPFSQENLYAITIDDTIFFHLNLFIKKGKEIFEETQKNKKKHTFYGDVRLAQEVYNNTSVTKITLNEIEALWAHEINHVLTLQDVNSKKFSFFSYPMSSKELQEANEISGMLTEIASHPESKLRFMNYSRHNLSLGSGGHTEAMETIQVEMLLELGFLDHLLQQKYQEDRATQNHLKIINFRFLHHSIDNVPQVIKDLEDAGYVNIKKQITDQFNPLNGPSTLNLPGYSPQQKNTIFSYLEEESYPQMHYARINFNDGFNFMEIDRYKLFKNITNNDVRTAARNVFNKIFEAPMTNITPQIPQDIRNFLEEHLEDLTPINSPTIPIKETNVGGIDLNPTMLDLQAQGSEIDWHLPAPPHTLESITFDGFEPIILQIFPTNLPALMTLQTNH